MDMRRASRLERHPHQLWGDRRSDAQKMLFTFSVSEDSILERGHFIRMAREQTDPQVLHERCDRFRPSLTEIADRRRTMPMLSEDSPRVRHDPAELESPKGGSQELLIHRRRSDRQDGCHAASFPLAVAVASHCKAFLIVLPSRISRIAPSPSP